MLATYNSGTANDNTAWYKPDYDVEFQLVTSDLSDTEFIYSVLKNAQNYLENTENILTYDNSSTQTTDFYDNSIDYSLLPTSSNSGYNCNSFSNSLLDYSGATNSEDYTDMTGIDAGKYKEIDYQYFIENGTNMTIINPLIN
ncbi:MAG TPA: hypothetical protein VLL98_02565 [Rickettsiales bacterium]|nr:hypothetical protein [Rickettsiales bacterium]